MILKNQFEVSYEEAILLLENITESLQADRSFSFEMKGHEAKVEVEEPLNLSLTISPNRFRIEFQWGDEKIEKDKEMAKADEDDTDWRDSFDQDLEDSTGIVVDSELEEPQEFHPYVKEVKLPEEIEAEEQVTAVEEIVEEEYEEITPSVQPPTRALSQKMSLNATTLSFEGGFWTPAFSVEEINSEWSLVNIDQELDNKRWDPTEEFSPPSVKQPEVRRSQAEVTSDDDLFSDLDELSTERSSVVPKQKTFDKPIPSIKKPPAKKISSGIPAPKTVDIAKKKATIPAPIKSGSKKLSIPKPNGQKSATEVSGSDIEEITEWKEPDREDISSGDDWVKPSEVLKKEKKSPKMLKMERATTAPPSPIKTKKEKGGPPKPPDKKGKKDDKKGWADWN
jgi:hypothetical protein